MLKLSRPHFWRNINPISLLLLPFSLLYYLIFLLKKHLRTPAVKLNPLVICIGNITIGGTGKTPLAIALGRNLQARGIKVAYLSRGFGGKENYQGLVHLKQHTHTDIGDEAIMLANTAPTYVGPNRAITGKMAEDDGAEVIIMDDGMQHHSLHKDLTMLVIDSDYQFGNQLLLPAGPLRQTIKSGIEEADIIVCTHAGNINMAAALTATLHRCKQLKPHFAINYLAENKEQLRNKKFIALCSIAAPEKFIHTAEKSGAIITATHFYPDHYSYSSLEIDHILAQAKMQGCRILTTTKDAAKMSPKQCREVTILQLKLEDVDNLMDYLSNWVLNNKGDHKTN